MTKTEAEEKVILKYIYKLKNCKINTKITSAIYWS